MSKMLKLINEFRDWDNMWKRFDKNPIAHIKPPNSNDFAEIMCKKYGINE